MRLPKTPEELSPFIDNTFLKPEGKEEDVKKFVEESNSFNFKTLFVFPSWVSFVKPLTKIPVGTVSGFPHGGETPEEKAFSASKALQLGAVEIDYVINIGRLKSKDYKYIEDEARIMRRVTKGYILKAIIETCYLTPEEKKIIVKIAEDQEVDFVKTSTGFGPYGAKVEDIRLIKENTKKIKVKASGGIRTLDFCLELIRNGAERIGTSTGVSIIKDAIKRYEREGKLWKK